MELCNDTITVLNIYADTTTKYKTFARTVISGVHVFGTYATSPTVDGLVSSKFYTIRIPINAEFGGKQYISPQGYIKSQVKDKYFTLADGDIILFGDIDTTGKTLADLKSSYSLVTITSVSDSTNVPVNKHWKVLGK